MLTLSAITIIFEREFLMNEAKEQVTIILEKSDSIKDVGWQLPTFNRIVGPTELADVAISWRHFYSKGLYPNGEMPPQSDKGLRALIHIAFQASLVTEEGKYSRARLFIYQGSWFRRPRVVVEFDEPIPANEDGVLALKRLAPRADSHDSALIMEEISEVWHCTGLATISDPINPIQIGRPDLNQRIQPPYGILIRIDGPGFLRVTDLFLPFVLHGGHIVQALDLLVAPPIHSLLQQIDLALTRDKHIPRLPAINGRVDPHCGLQIEFALSRIVAKMREARKGGALIFPSDTTTHLIEFKTIKSGPGLGDALHSFYAASEASAAAKSTEELRTALLQWQNAHQMVLRFTDFIAGLSKVDGCVVLNSNF